MKETIIKDFSEKFATAIIQDIIIPGLQNPQKSLGIFPSEDTTPPEGMRYKQILKKYKYGSDDHPSYNDLINIYINDCIQEEKDREKLDNLLNEAILQLTDIATKSRMSNVKYYSFCQEIVRLVQKLKSELNLIRRKSKLNKKYSEFCREIRALVNRILKGKCLIVYFYDKNHVETSICVNELRLGIPPEKNECHFMYDDIKDGQYTINILNILDIIRIET